MNAYKNYISELNLSEDFKSNLIQNLLGQNSGSEIVTPKWEIHRGNIKTKTIAIAAMVAACIIAFVATLTVVLNNRDNGMQLAENEFLLEYANTDPVPSYSSICAYRFGMTEFSADDFKIKFYFLNRGASVPSATISINYINKDTGEQENYIVREINDYSSYEYSGNVIYYEDADCGGRCKITFNHIEEITIPKDIVTNASGFIRLYIYGIDYDMLAGYDELEIDGERYNYCGYAGFEYSLDCDTVTLESSLYAVYNGNWMALWSSENYSQ